MTNDRSHEANESTTIESINPPDDITTQFGFRISNQSFTDVSKLRNNPLIQFNQLDRHVAGRNSDKWYTIGVICCATTKKKSSKGTDFYSLRLIDQTVDVSISCCFFGSAAEQVLGWKPGQLILIMDPTIVRSNALTANRSLKQVNQATISLCVTKSTQLSLIGTAVDFKQCSATKAVNRTDPLFSLSDAAGTRCPNWFDSTRGVSNKPSLNQSLNQSSINQSVTPPSALSHHTLCPQHYMASYRRAASARPTVNRQTTVFGELIKAPVHPQARKRRKLG